MTKPLSKDDIHHLTVEAEQSFMQGDFASAEYIIRRFFKSLQEENESLKSKVKRMRKELSAHALHTKRQFFSTQDYLEYDEDDRR